MRLLVLNRRTSAPVTKGHFGRLLVFDDMVWSTRHQDSKLIDVCTGASLGSRSCAQPSARPRAAAVRVSRTRLQRLAGDKIAVSVRQCESARWESLARYARCACMRSRARPTMQRFCSSSRLGRRIGLGSVRLLTIAAAVLPRPPCLAANSVGFKQTKKCINTYKMHPAV